MISKEKREKLEERMAKLQITEAELVGKFIIGSGNGGQKLYKTASTVYQPLENLQIISKQI